MSTDHPSDDRILPPAAAERLLARSAELDAAWTAGGVPVARLRDAAREAGISDDAFAAALRESEAADVDTDPLAQHGGGSAPIWVRVCLLGMLDRRAAMVFYWTLMVLSTVAMLGVVALVLTAPAMSTPILLLSLLSLWFVFGTWTTSRAVRWTDAHGWHRLP